MLCPCLLQHCQGKNLIHFIFISVCVIILVIPYAVKQCSLLLFFPQALYHSRRLYFACFKEKKSCSLWVNANTVPFVRHTTFLYRHINDLPLTTGRDPSFKYIHIGCIKDKDFLVVHELWIS